MIGIFRTTAISFLLLAAVAAQACAQLGAGASTETSCCFEQGCDCATLPFRLIDQMIVIRGTLNGIDIDIALDTGFGGRGLLLLDPGLGEKLGLSYTGKAHLGGGGREGMQQADVAFGVDIEFPGVSFSDQMILVLDQRGILTEWEPEGIMGGTLFDCVVEIDYVRSEVRLHEPSGYRPPKGAASLPIGLSQGIPVIDAVVDPGEGQPLAVRLLVDTGVAGIPLLLFSYSHERLRVPDRYIETMQHGINGVMLSRIGRIESFRIGPHAFDDLVTAFVDSVSMGPAVMLGQNGFVGNETLARFEVSFDYSRRRMYLKPNKRFEDRYEFDMAGLVLETIDGGKRKVFDVIDGSPADGSSILEGDVILSVDKRDIRRIGYERLDHLFKREGKMVELLVERDGERFIVKLRLERLI